MEFYEWQTGALAPSWLSGPIGEAWALAMGHLKDAIATAAKEAVMARLPMLAPWDALPSIGADRALERMPTQSGDAYRAFLRDAWSVWATGGTRRGILNAVTRTGFGTPAIYTGTEIDLGGSVYPGFWDEGTWARYVIVLTGHPWQSDGLWGDDGTWGDGGTWGSTARPDEVELLLRQVQLWNGAHAECAFIAIPFGDTELWGIPPEAVWTDDDDDIWSDDDCAYFIPLQIGHIRWHGLNRYSNGWASAPSRRSRSSYPRAKCIRFSSPKPARFASTLQAAPSSPASPRLPTLRTPPR